MLLMYCHTTRTRFIKAATGTDCKGSGHSVTASGLISSKALSSAFLWGENLPSVHIATVFFLGMDSSLFMDGEGFHYWQVDDGDGGAYLREVSSRVEWRFCLQKDNDEIVFPPPPHTIHAIVESPLHNISFIWFCQNDIMHMPSMLCITSLRMITLL